MQASIHKRTGSFKARLTHGAPPPESIRLPEAPTQGRFRRERGAKRCFSPPVSRKQTRPPHVKWKIKRGHGAQKASQLPCPARRNRPAILIFAPHCAGARAILRGINKAPHRQTNHYWRRLFPPGPPRRAANVQSSATANLQRRNPISSRSCAWRDFILHSKRCGARN